MLVVPGVVAVCMLYVAVPVIVAEPEVGSANALPRSRALTKGSRGTILLVVLLVFAFALADTATLVKVFE